MLQITIPGIEMWDEVSSCFVTYEPCTLELEHSLVSLSKWESKWCKPFLSSDKTDEETLDYIKFMTMTEGVSPDVYTRLTQQNIEQVRDYIADPMTATTFKKEQGKRNNEVITAELIYYWMIALNIPFECRYWHLNQLITLIRVCSIKNAPAKKMSKNEIRRQNAALNAARLKQFNTNG